MIITDLKVLNTVTALGADLVVGSHATTLGGSRPIPNTSIISVEQVAPVVEVKEVYTITPTAANSTDYTLTINGYNTATGLRMSVPITVTSDATATATEICDLFRTAIGTVSNLNVVASGTTTLVLTATGILSTGQFPQLACFTVTTADTNLAVVNTTDGVPSVGLAAQLVWEYPANPTNPNSDSGYPAMSNLTSGYYYQQVKINYAPAAGSGSAAWSGEINLNQVVALVKVGTSATATTSNFATLCGAWGTIAGLAAGYKYTIVATGANVGFASNAATRASGSFLTELLTSGDIIAISDGATTAANAYATVLLPYAASTTAGSLTATDALIDVSATVSAGAAFVVHKTNIPN